MYNRFTLHTAETNTTLGQLCECAQLLNCSVAQSCLTLFTPWTVTQQAPLSTEFSRQDYWRGLPFPSPVSPITTEVVVGTIKRDEFN